MQPRIEGLSEAEELTVGITVTEDGAVSLIGVIQNHQPTSPRTLLQRLNERENKSHFPGQAFKLDDNDSEIGAIKPPKKLSTRAKLLRVGIPIISISALLVANFFQRDKNSNSASSTLPSVRKLS